MSETSNLPLSTIVEALNLEEIRYETDRDGDIHFVMVRRKGKDLSFYIFTSAANKGILSLACMVTRWFEPRQVTDLLVHANDWNRDKRIPCAIVSGPDEDNDYQLRLDYSVFCQSGVDVEFVRTTIQMFVAASWNFWDEADKKF